MPVRICDTSKKTIYLDNSTLCDAFKVQRPNGGGVDLAYLPLKGWIERVAREANLCLSLYHLSELARWADTTSADQMVQWYGSMPMVMVRSQGDVDDAEVLYWSQVASGESPIPKGFAFAPSIAGAFTALAPGKRAAIEAETDPLAKFLEVMRLRGSDHDIQQFLAAAEKFRADREWADRQGWTDAKKKSVTEDKLKSAIRLRACWQSEVCEHLLGRKLDTRNDVLVRLYGSDPRVLPRLRVSQAFTSGVCEVVLRKAPNSRGFNQALGGSLYDWMHLVGAAYCDVFTCDGAVADWLGDLRVGFGLPKQLTAKNPGGPAGFVRDLMATWP